MTKFLSALLGGGLALLLLASCVTAKMDKDHNQDPSIRLEPKALQLSVRPEVYLLRVDLVRAYHPESRSSFDGKRTIYYTVNVPNSYHFVAVEFGNGILYDYNGNLAIDLVAYFKLEDFGKFTIKRVPVSRMFGPAITLEKKDDTFTWPNAGLFSPGYKVQFNDNKVEIDSGPLAGKIQIETSAKGIKFDPRGFLGLGKVEVIQSDPNHVSFPGFWGDKTFVLDAPDQIAVDGGFAAQRQKDHITFTYNGWFGLKSEFTLVQTAKGFIFFDKNNHGTEVIREGDIITVLQNGAKTISYQIIPTD